MKVFRALAEFLLLLPAACLTGNPDVTKAATSLAVVPLDIRTAGGKAHAFKVEVARSESEQARGLMFRDKLAPNRGMIFPMNPPRPASFWMKNTVISLDLIFIAPDGRISNIAANAVPYNLAPLTSIGPVKGVLEIPGGRAAELGIAPGDKVAW